MIFMDRKKNRPGVLAVLAISAGLLGSVAVDMIADRINGGKSAENKVEREDIREERDRSNNRVFAEYIAGFEGRRNRVYDPNPNDGKDEPTIGIGHFLERGDSRETFDRILPEVNHDSVRNGRKILTDNEVDRLFKHDIQIYIDRARNLIGNFDTFPEYLQTALVDMSYRGDLGDSPKTRILLNEGRFRDAADEYINRREYMEAESNGMRGLRIRMDSNRNRILNYAQEIESARDMAR